MGIASIRRHYNDRALHKEPAPLPAYITREEHEARIGEVQRKNDAELARMRGAATPREGASPEEIAKLKEEHELELSLLQESYAKELADLRSRLPQEESAGESEPQGEDARGESHGETKPEGEGKRSKKK